MRHLLFVLVFILVAVPSFAATTTNCKIVTQTEYSATTVSAKALTGSPDTRCMIIENKGTTNIFVKAGAVHSGTEGILIVPNGAWEPIYPPINDLYIESASGTDTVTIFVGK